MGYRPYPNAERALRQAKRGHITWFQPAAGHAPWLLTPERIDFSPIRLPRVPEGWGDTAGENLRRAFASLRQNRPGERA